MAETAPLALAHAHARKAAQETQQTHWTKAAAEHQNAAVDFARATKGTSDAEALRVLKLLEAQHERLARIIRSQDTVQPSKLDSVPAHDVEGLTGKEAAPKVLLAAKPTLPNIKSPTSALAAARLGSHARDSSPSLAREIASRRGIPAQSRTQPSAAAQARAQQLSPESQRRPPTVLASHIPPSIMDSQANLRQARASRKSDDEEGFAKFYSGLTTGTMSKLSSVLAYAGLPLTADDIKTEPKSVRETVRAGNEPDVKKLFSKAALNAIEDEHRQRGTLGHGFGPAESFYVVPTSGMTKFYSGILGTAHHHLGGIGEDDEGAFVDAREVPGPPSPKHSRSLRSRRDSFGKSRTAEELELENVTLKQTLEQLAGRLANFEAHAQDASMAALTQSMATLRPPGAVSDAVTNERVRQLELQIEKDADERQGLEALAIKQEKQLKRYEKKYQEIKTGARMKMKDRVKTVTDENVSEEKESGQPNTGSNV